MRSPRSQLIRLLAEQLVAQALADRAAQRDKLQPPAQEQPANARRHLRPVQLRSTAANVD